MINEQNITLAVLGAGNFARFAVAELIQIPGVRLAGTYDASEENARLLLQLAPDAKLYDSYESLLDDPAVQLVYIATPPSLHYGQAKAALEHGKHVICEKPATLRLDQAETLRSLAAEKDLLFVVNLMQRYNPLYLAVSELIEQGVLGDFLHGFFENYASDEFLPPSHWFWDTSKSGGIFIEHGVHFFDMFAGWLGQGTVVAAQQLKRTDYEHVTDRVQATVLYAGGLVNFYHGFDQPKLMDRQEMRLQFEKGDVTLFGWVPTRLELNAIATPDDLAALQRIFPTALIEEKATYHPPRRVEGRFKSHEITHQLHLDTGHGMVKEDLYHQLIRDLFSDQFQWVHDRQHQRRIDADNAVNSLKLAVEADKIAVKIA